MQLMQQLMQLDAAKWDFGVAAFKTCGITRNALCLFTK
jgi:hypothetical protein